MITRFITAEIPLQFSPAEMQRAIAAELQKQGEPLRWAITAIDPERCTVRIEAVVTLNSDSS